MRKAMQGADEEDAIEPEENYMVKVKNSNKKEWKPRTLPKGTTVEQMEEEFLDRYANLIVRLLDHLHEQKLKAKVTAESETKAKE